MVTVRAAEAADAETWLEMRCALWPDGSKDEHQSEIQQFFRGEFPRNPWAVLVAQDEGHGIVGFAELSTRPYAEGCRTSRVAYLEGWFVHPVFRKRGIGSALISASEEWGRDQGCTEFASDVEPDNSVSMSAHRAAGFVEVGMVRCFMKYL